MTSNVLSLNLFYQLRAVPELKGVSISAPWMMVVMTVMVLKKMCLRSPRISCWNLCASKFHAGMVVTPNSKCPGLSSESSEC